jgi:hypothetical protein
MSEMDHSRSSVERVETDRLGELSSRPKSAFRGWPKFRLVIPAFGYKVAVPQHGQIRPRLAICGRLPVGKGFLDGHAVLVGATICPAFGYGALRWPLAILLSADQVPVETSQSRCCSG